MDEHTTNIVAIAASLTEAEREALRLFKDRKWVFSDNTPGFHSLFTRRMVVRDFDGSLPAWYFELTALGNAVLAALEAAPANALGESEGGGVRITPFFRWYDIWVGVFIDTKKRTIYICPLPMVGVKVELPPPPPKEYGSFEEWYGSNKK